VGLHPAASVLRSDLSRRLGGGENGTPEIASFTIWYNIVRPIAVGAMLVAACNTLFGMRSSIMQSIFGAWDASRHAGSGVAVERTEQDIPNRWVAISVALLLVPVTAIYTLHRRLVRRPVPRWS
jgi:uncharacterized oligopeptide transporter (OPT) family protein